MSNKISTVIITLNEASNIARCIESVNAISDEIIVLDSGSTDNTVEICHKYSKVTCLQTEWLGYSKTKNKGAELAKNQYILSIDADEHLDEAAIRSIQDLTNSLTQDAYSLNRKNYYGQKWIKYAGWYPDVKIRLYNKSKACWVGDFVHETLQLKENAAITHLTGNIVHFTIRDYKHHLETINKYARLAAQRDVSSGKRINALRAITSTCAHFIKIYFVKLGLLHGRIGFTIAVNSAKSKWLRYKFAQEISS